MPKKPLRTVKFMGRKQTIFLDFETVKNDFPHLTLIQMAEKYGCNKCVVSKFCKNHGLFKPRFKKEETALIGGLTMNQFSLLQKHLDIIQVEERMFVLFNQLILIERF